MKIRKVELRLIQPDFTKSSNPNMKNFTGGCYPIMIRIITDEGIYGDGAVSLGFGVGQTAVIELAKDFARRIIGKNALETEVIWEMLHNTRAFPTWLYQSVQSGYDMALWDIKGKAFNQPLYVLLGGAQRKKMRAYASQLQFGWIDSKHMAASPEDYANNAKKAVEAGYDAVKVDFWAYDEDGRPMTHDMRKGLVTPRIMNIVEDRVAATREAIGPDVDLILEGHAFTDVTTAIQFAQRLEKYNILFFEEPCFQTPENYKRVREKLPMPLAGGEQSVTRWDFAPYLINGSMQILQPDVGNCGGISELMKIANFADVFDASIQGHCCETPIILSATLHIEAAIPNFAIHEQHIECYQPYLNELFTNTWYPENGYYTVPEGPGLGTELSEYALKHCQLWTIE